MPDPPGRPVQVLRTEITPNAFVAEIAATIDEGILKRPDKEARLRLLLNDYVARVIAARGAGTKARGPRVEADAPQAARGGRQHDGGTAAPPPARRGHHTAAEPMHTAAMTLFGPGPGSETAMLSGASGADPTLLLADVANATMAVIASHPGASGGVGNWELLGQILRHYLDKARATIANLSKEVTVLHARFEKETAECEDAVRQLRHQAASSHGASGCGVL